LIVAQRVKVNCSLEFIKYIKSTLNKLAFFLNKLVGRQCTSGSTVELAPMGAT
jgi:hypothetical protein